MSITAKFVQTFSAPGELFASLKSDKATGWWAPWLLITVLMLLISLLTLGKIDWTSLIEGELAKSSEPIPPEAVQSAIDIGTSFGKIQTVAGPLLMPLIMYMFCGGFFWLLVNVAFKKPISFMQCVALYAWTDLVNIPRYLISALGVLRAESFTAVAEFKALDCGYPLFFYSGDLMEITPKLMAGLTVVNLFTLIHFAYIAFGLEAIAGLSRVRALLVAFVPYFLLALLSLIPAFLFK